MASSCSRRSRSTWALSGRSCSTWWGRSTTPSCPARPAAICFKAIYAAQANAPSHPRGDVRDRRSRHRLAGAGGARRSDVRRRPIVKSMRNDPARRKCVQICHRLAADHPGHDRGLARLLHADAFAARSGWIGCFAVCRCSGTCSMRSRRWRSIGRRPMARAVDDAGHAARALAGGDFRHLRRQSVRPAAASALLLGRRAGGRPRRLNPDLPARGRRDGVLRDSPDQTPGRAPSARRSRSPCPSASCRFSGT